MTYSMPQAKFLADLADERRAARLRDLTIAMQTAQHADAAGFKRFLKSLED